MKCSQITGIYEWMASEKPWHFASMRHLFLSQWRGGRWIRNVNYVYVYTNMSFAIWYSRHKVSAHTVHIPRQRGICYAYLKNEIIIIIKILNINKNYVGNGKPSHKNGHKETNWTAKLNRRREQKCKNMNELMNLLWAVSGLCGLCQHKHMIRAHALVRMKSAKYFVFYFCFFSFFCWRRTYTIS